MIFFRCKKFICSNTGKHDLYFLCIQGEWKCAFKLPLPFAIWPTLFNFASDHFSERPMYIVWWDQKFWPGPRPGPEIWPDRDWDQWTGPALVRNRDWKCDNQHNSPQKLCFSFTKTFLRTYFFIHSDFHDLSGRTGGGARNTVLGELYWLIYKFLKAFDPPPGLRQWNLRYGLWNKWNNFRIIKSFMASTLYRIFAFLEQSKS